MIRIFFCSCLILIVACGDDDGTGDASLPDSGPTADSGPVVDATTGDTTVDDAGGSDGSADATTPEDSGAADGSPDTANVDAGPGVCDGIEIGNACESSRECSQGTHECVNGMCRPTGRLACTSPDMNCPSRTTPECVLPTGSRTGICLTTEEALCVCTELAGAYNCGS